MRKIAIILIAVTLVYFAGYRLTQRTPISGTLAIAQEELVVNWDDPQLYDGSLYGQILTVKGTIVNTYNSGKACFLNFHDNWKKYFTAVIFKSDFHKFGAPEDDYYLRKVKIRGMLKEYQGKPEIIVKTPSQIEVLK